VFFIFTKNFHNLYSNSSKNIKISQIYCGIAGMGIWFISKLNYKTYLGFSENLNLKLKFKILLIKLTLGKKRIWIRIEILKIYRFYMNKEIILMRKNIFNTKINFKK